MQFTDRQTDIWNYTVVVLQKNKDKWKIDRLYHAGDDKYKTLKKVIGPKKLLTPILNRTIS